MHATRPKYQRSEKDAMWALWWNTSYFDFNKRVCSVKRLLILKGTCHKEYSNNFTSPQNILRHWNWGTWSMGLQENNISMAFLLRINDKIHLVCSVVCVMILRSFVTMRINWKHTMRIYTNKSYGVADNCGFESHSHGPMHVCARTRSILSLFVPLFV